MKTIAALILFSVISAGAQAAGYKIPANTVICFTEAGYEQQIALITQGHKRLAATCGVTSRDLPVVVLEFNLFSASRVMATETDSELWVGGDQLVSE